MVAILKSTLGIASYGLNMGSVVSGDANLRPGRRDRKRLDPRLYCVVSHGPSTGIEIAEALAASSTTQSELRTLDVIQTMALAECLGILNHS